MRKPARFVAKLVELTGTVKGRYRLAAVVYDERFRPLAFGTNSYVKTHPLQASASDHPMRVFVHAEVQALVRANGKKKRGILVLRTNKKGELCLAKPCGACMTLIMESGIKEVLYSDNTGGIVYSRLTVTG